MPSAATPFPTHLLTREAFDIYRQHLARDGVIAVHVSNSYLRLAPVVRRLAEDCGMGASRIDDSGNAKAACKASSLGSWSRTTTAFFKANPSGPSDWGDDNLQAALDRPVQQSVPDSHARRGRNRHADGGVVPRIALPTARPLSLASVLREKSDL